MTTTVRGFHDGWKGGRLLPWIGLSGLPYTCGFHGLHDTGERLGVWPTLIERERVEPSIRIEIIEA